MSEKYRPSNGTEGECFFESWCCHCARDKAMREGEDFDACDDDEECDIIGDTFAYDIDHPKYPKEWIYDVNGVPCCTAFVDAEDEIPAAHDELTIDMFQERT